LWRRIELLRQVCVSRNLGLDDIQCKGEPTVEMEDLRKEFEDSPGWSEQTRLSRSIEIKQQEVLQEHTLWSFCFRRYPRRNASTPRSLHSRSLYRATGILISICSTLWKLKKPIRHGQGNPPRHCKLSYHACTASEACI